MSKKIIFLLLVVYVLFNISAYAAITTSSTTCKHTSVKNEYVSNGAKGHKVTAKCLSCGATVGKIIENQAHSYVNEDEVEIEAKGSTFSVTAKKGSTTSGKTTTKAPTSTSVMPQTTGSTQNVPVGKGVCKYCGRSNASYSVTPTLSIQSSITIKQGDIRKILVMVGSSIITGWETSDASIVTVNQTGSVKGMKPGIATVYAKAKDGSICFCTVTVQGPDGKMPASFKTSTLSEADMDRLRTGERALLNKLIDNIEIVISGNTATLKNADGMAVSWSSSNKELLTISSTGTNSATLTMDKTKDGGYVTITAKLTNAEDIKKVKDGKSTYTCQVAVDKGTGKYTILKIDGHYTAINDVPWSDVAVIGVLSDGGFGIPQNLALNSPELANVNFYMIDPHNGNYDQDSTIDNPATKYALEHYKGKEVYLYSHSAGGYHMLDLYESLTKAGIKVKGVLFADVYPKNGDAETLAKAGAEVYIYGATGSREISERTRREGSKLASEYSNVHYGQLQGIGHGAAGGVGSIVTAMIDGKIDNSAVVSASNIRVESSGTVDSSEVRFNASSNSGGSSGGGGGGYSGGSSSGGGGGYSGGSSSGGSSGGSYSGGSSTGTSTSGNPSKGIVVEDFKDGVFYVTNGEKKQLKVKLFYNSREVSNPNFSFSGYDNNIIGLNNNVVEAKKAGVTEVTIIAKDYYKDNDSTSWAKLTIQIAVVDPKISIIDADTNKGIGRVFLEVGESINVGGMLISNYETELDLNKATFLWASRDPSIVTVDERGKITAISEGETSILVTGMYNEGARVVTGECSVSVKKMIQSLKIEPTEITVEKRSTGTVNLTFTPDNADAKKLLWLSSNPKVALASRNGTIMGLDIGTCVITVKDLDSGLTASTNVTVIKGKNSGAEFASEKFNCFKPLIDRNTYSEADWSRMERELREKVEEAGWGTRAGVVTAAMYLCSLDYAVPYRGTPMDREHYQGVYPKIGLNREWGKFVPLKIDLTAYGRQYKKGGYYRNGLDCTGFVSWALVNGGLRKENDSTWTKFPKETHDLRDWKDKVLPGDLAQVWDSKQKAYTHFALVIGVDGDTIYIAEESGKLQVSSWSMSKNANNWHIVPMEREYAAANGEGNMPDVDW